MGLDVTVIELPLVDANLPTASDGKEPLVRAAGMRTLDPKPPYGVLQTGR
jgi:hypothetical protein